MSEPFTPRLSPVATAEWLSGWLIATQTAATLSARLCLPLGATASDDHLVELVIDGRIEPIPDTEPAAASVRSTLVRRVGDV